MAQQYVLADNMFQTQGSGSFTAHQDLIAGATALSYGTSQASVVDNPTWFPWGCDSLSSTETSLLTTNLKYLDDKGRPCLMLRLRHVARSARRKASLVEVLRERVYGRTVPTRRHCRRLERV